jgi:hypothetical protein
VVFARVGVESPITIFSLLRVLGVLCGQKITKLPTYPIPEKRLFLPEE